MSCQRHNKYLDSESYLTKHHIDFYLGDAIKQILHCKSSNIKVEPSNFLHQYFRSVKRGSHILFREYKFVTSTPWNRLSFLRKFLKTFEHIHLNGDLLKAHDFHSLLCLMCPDFDKEMLRKTIEIILVEDAFDSVIPFMDFMYAFQFRFYYHEFTVKCWEIFNNTQNTNNRTEHEDKELSGHFVLSKLQNSVYKDGKDNPLTPPEGILRQILESSPSIDYYRLLTVLCKDEQICQEIGVISGRRMSTLCSKPIVIPT